MRGMDTLLMDMAADEDLFTALMVKLKSLALDYVDALPVRRRPPTRCVRSGDRSGHDGPAP